MDLIQSVSHTWSATIRMFPNNSRSAIPVKTKTDLFYTLPATALTPLPFRSLSNFYNRDTDGPPWQISAPDPIQQGGFQTEFYTSFKIRTCSTTYIRKELINYTFGKKQKKKTKHKDYTVPSTLRACAVYRNSSTISRMTVGNGNLSVLDCSLDWQVKGKASIRLMTMQTTLAKLFILYYSFPHLPLTMTMTMTLKRIPSKSLYCAATQHKTPYWN